MFYAIGTLPREVVIWDSSDGTYGSVRRMDLRDIIKTGVHVKCVEVTKYDTLEISYGFWYKFYIIDRHILYIETPTFSAIVGRDCVYYLYKDRLYQFDVRVSPYNIQVLYTGSDCYEVNKEFFGSNLFIVPNTDGILFMSGGAVISKIRNTDFNKVYSLPYTVHQFHRLALGVDNLKIL